MWLNRGLWVVMLALNAGQGVADDWLQWRGPTLSGASAAEDLPLTWSVDTGDHVAWECALPGIGSSTPIVVGERLFLTTSRKDHAALFAVAVDRKTGAIRWQRNLGVGREVYRRTMAKPSAVSDGQHVWFYFGQGSLACLTLNGTLRWSRNLETEYGRFATKFGYSASPLLHKGKLYVPLLYRVDEDDARANTGKLLLLINPENGKTLETVVRQTPALKESLDSYTTPLPAPCGIIVTGADLVTCHDPENGALRWKFDFTPQARKTNWRIVAGPVVADGGIVSPFPRGRTLVALDTEGRERWRYEGDVPDVCTPAYDQGLLYVLDGARRYITCLDARSGRELWKDKLPCKKPLFASPLVADERVYCVSLGGEVVVYAAGRSKRRLAGFETYDQKCAASLIAVDDALFMRTPDKLLCLRK